MLAIALLLMATFTLGFQDALMKLMSEHTSFWQIQLLRSVCNLLILLVLAKLANNMRLLIPVNWRGVFLRAAFLTVCMFFFFAGAPYLSVTQMGAGLYTYPIFVCLLAGPVLGEVIGKWRITSIVVGTTGGMLMLSPWKEDFSLIQILPIIAGFFFACNLLTLRKSCRKESTLALAFAAGLIFLLSAITGVSILTLIPLPESAQQSMPFVAIAWPTLTLFVAGFAVLASLLNLTGNICMTRAYQSADASLLAPLDFSYLFFAAIWGRVIFDNWPTQSMLFGVLLIVCAGAIIAWREQVSVKNKHHALDV